jgi:hypothetical protein
MKCVEEERNDKECNFPILCDGIFLRTTCCLFSRHKNLINKVVDKRSVTRTMPAEGSGRDPS